MGSGMATLLIKGRVYPSLEQLHCANCLSRYICLFHVKSSLEGRTMITGSENDGTPPRRQPYRPGVSPSSFKVLICLVSGFLARRNSNFCRVGYSIVWYSLWRVLWGNRDGQLASLSWRLPQLVSSHTYNPDAQCFRSSERNSVAEIHSRSRHSPKINKLLREELNVPFNNHNILREINLRETAAPSCGFHGKIVQPYF